MRTLLDGAIDGQRDAQSCNFEINKHTTNPLSSRKLSKEPKPNLPAAGGPSCNTSRKMTMTKSHLVAANSSLEDTETLSSDAYRVSSFQYKLPLPLKDSSSAFDVQGGLNRTGKTAPINDQGIIWH